MDFFKNIIGFFLEVLNFSLILLWGYFLFLAGSAGLIFIACLVSQLLKFNQ